MWETGRPVLQTKDGRPEYFPSAYSLIVMLDEADKLFERNIAGRLIRHLGTVGSDLVEHKFGFRVGSSTYDAINRLKGCMEEVLAQGRMMLMVTLDVANAFNTIPWGYVREALKYHEMLPYLSRITCPKSTLRT